MTAKYSIIWLDDRVEELDFLIETFRACGFFVIPCRSHEEALCHFGAESCDAVIADMRIVDPKGMRFGTDTLKDIRRLREVPVVILSSFLYVERYESILRSLEFPCLELEKVPGLNTADEVVRCLVKPIEDWINNAKVSKHNIQPASLDPFEVSFEEYLRLGLNDRVALTRRVKKLCEGAIKKSREDGYCWLLYCGSKESPRVKIKDPEEVYDEERILQVASDLGAAPYPIFQPIRCEEIGWSSGCGNHSGLMGYPTLTVEIKDTRREFHFDTGNEFTLMSYEFLSDLGIVKPPASAPAPLDVNGTEVLIVRKSFGAMLISQDEQTTKRIILHVNAVLDWETALHARKCVADCQHTEMTTIGQVCPYRQGLIGRNILRQEGMRIVFDTSSRRTLLSS